MENQNPPPPPPPPAPQEEPDAKKLKTSTTATTSDDEERTTITATTEKKPRYKRRKVAILFAYCGVGYQGMQKNPGAKTIEGDLEEALYFAGAVPEHDRGCPKRFDFARSARTDKGVSAVGQVVSGKFYVDPPGFVERLNNNLPPQFRVFGYKRVTASFSAKKFCDRRRYVYLLPVFALDPASHRDRESVLASLGSGNELVKCLECSERGRKAVGVIGNQKTGTRTGSEVEIQSVILSNNLGALSDSNVKENLTSLPNGNGYKEVLNTESVTEEGKSLENSSALGNGCDNNSNSDTITEANRAAGEVNGVGNEEGCSIVKENAFCYGDKEKERFNKILKLYEGTHNFHNFTTRTKAEDPSAKRYIISFHANKTVAVDGVEFVKCEVVGQSFMLHQIRKMIGVAVAIMRNCAPESFIETALQQDVRVNVPTAPEVGLYLDECFFTSYNQKWRDTHEEVSMKAYAHEAEEFKLKHIYSHIASTEHKEGAVAVWLHSLNYRNYPDLDPKERGGGAMAAPKAGVEETTRCIDSPYPRNKTFDPFPEANPLPGFMASGRVYVTPVGFYEEPTVAEVDLEHLATVMKHRLKLILPYIHKLEVHYGCSDFETTTDSIAAAVDMMVDTAMAVTYNRLRYVLQNFAPTVCTARMNSRSPLSNKYKFPAFISSVLSSIGPLRVMDGAENMLIVYATAADRMRNYGRAKPFNFKCGQFLRFIDSLEAIGIPLAPIDVKAVLRGGSFFTTVVPTHQRGLWNFTASFHHSHYEHEDVVRAWLMLGDDPALRAFEDCSMRIECCTTPAIVDAIIAARPENVAADLDGATAAARPVGGVFPVNVFGIRPAVAAEGSNPAIPAAAYIVGQGNERYYSTSLARSLCEGEMISWLRYLLLSPSKPRLDQRSTGFYA